MIVLIDCGEDMLFVPTWMITVYKVNSELRKLCKRKYFLFCNLYKSCLYNNSPDPTLFAPKDGLHLNYAGTDLS
jgi:hypothetical protein